ncbi:50S ribosomal protein L25/general stress protein Ctc [Haloglycomyces albus]|uniref:50S ribosomal protein L25/general stress protein Ctc n=1 Tax=Haloglycomyces albus TaxID=526067 RepID=UPI00046D5E08|nr:50S ribosomal protein L25/general stress protein Ctc [Haloglycomyces albus]
MSEVKISAEIRTDFGKGAARRTRRAGKVPAVIYGHGSEPRHISLPTLEFATIIRNGGLNQLIQVEVEGGAQELVMPKDVQIDPLKDSLVHADLLIVSRSEKITTDVPLNFVGEPEKGGIVVHELDTLSVEAAATTIPESIEVSLEGLPVGESISASAVDLPKGVDLITEADQVLASVTVPRASAVEDEEASEEESGESAE